MPCNCNRFSRDMSIRVNRHVLPLEYGLAGYISRLMIFHTHCIKEMVVENLHVVASSCILFPTCVVYFSKVMQREA